MITEVTVSLDGREISVNRLSVRKIHEVGQKIFDLRRRQVIEDCQEVGMTSEQTVEKVSQLRIGWDQGTEIKRQAYTDLGARMFIAAALGDSGEDLDVMDSVSDLAEIVTASALVCGLWNPFENQEDAEKEKTDSDLEEIVSDDR